MRKDVVDAARSWLSSSVACIQDKKQIDQCILDKRRFKTNEITREISVNHGKKRCKIVVSFSGKCVILRKQGTCGKLVEMLGKV